MVANTATALAHFSWYEEGELDKCSAPSSSYSVSHSQGSRLNSSHEFGSRLSGRDAKPLQAWTHVVMRTDNSNSSSLSTCQTNGHEKPKILFDCESDSGAEEEEEEEQADAPEGDSAGVLELPSVGSRRHAEGTCTPCVFEHAKVTMAGLGCRNGKDCDFCHLSHTRKSKTRPCKGKRDRYKKLLTRIESMINANPDTVMDVVASLPPSVERQQELKERLIAKFQKHADEVKEQRSPQHEHTNSGGQGQQEPTATPKPRRGGLSL